MTQQMAAHLLTDTVWLDGHLTDLRTEYGARARALSTAVSDTFGERIAASTADGGMFVWIRFADGTDTTRLLPDALAQGVAFVPGRAFADTTEYAAAARLCFASSPAPVLTEAIGRLGEAHALS